MLYLTFASLTQTSAASSLEGKVGKVLVLKSERRLLLLNRGNVLKSCRVSLGRRPAGPGLTESDSRTPEGFYWTDRRKASNNYSLFMYISYPNARDVAKAREESLPVGDVIMIHGISLDDEYPEWCSSTLNWTSGYIAIDNTDIREAWSVVKGGTLIGVHP